MEARVSLNYVRHPKHGRFCQMEKKLITTCNPYPLEKLEILYRDSSYKPSKEEIRTFRKETGIPLMHCKYSLAIANGDWEKAKHLIYSGRYGIDGTIR